MNSTEFLAIRNIQKGCKATDYEAAKFLDMVNAGHKESEAVLGLAMIEVANANYQPGGTPPLPPWCAST